MTLLDRVLRPINRIATRRLLAEAREKVWRNTVAMDRARRDGHGCYSAARTDLERLSGARVSDLTAPGPVLLKLALRGFGVLLPGA
jgi:hypothetical protein